MLCITATHPIQYQAPLFRMLAQDFKLPLHVVFGSDFSVQGYFDKEFNTKLAWDTDLTSGYAHTFLSKTAQGGAKNYDEVSGDALLGTIRSLQPQAIMALGYAHRFDRSAMRAAKVLAKPLMLRGESSDAAQQRHWLKRIVRDMHLRRLYRRISAFLYIGTHAKSHYERLGVAQDKLWFSPYGVDETPLALDAQTLAENRRQEREARGWQADDVVVLCSGKLFAKKGQDLLLAAAGKLPPALQSNLVLALLGEGEARVALSEAAANLAAVRVHFYGFKNQRDISAIYAAADIAAQPSRAGETWGLVVNEAMLHGLPVIASSLVGSAIDLITPDRTGQIVASDDADALAAALQREIERLPRHRAEDSQAMAKKFSLQAAAQGIVQAYSAVLQQRGHEVLR
jgi:glycosyltransferase involved in cell wall biosynthesis